MVHHFHDHFHVLKGEDCCDRFIQHLDDLGELEESNESKPREIISLFHNLKGFDGVFILNSLYNDMRDDECQLTVGSKVLSFASGNLTFKDSLCFLAYRLEQFPDTFNLPELKKGFFPHAFNTRANQGYHGPIPSLEHYDPKGKKDKQKADLETWHADQVLCNVEFDLQHEMEYCKSDVALLQGGCEAITKEFTHHASFNPFARCMSIASACHLYWCTKHLRHDTIAVEPTNRW